MQGFVDALLMVFEWFCCSLTAWLVVPIWALSNDSWKVPKLLWLVN